jgi:hypothetical protein
MMWHELPEEAKLEAITFVVRIVAAVSLVYFLGLSIAVAISWESNHSILWAMLHGILSWLFVIYHAIAA